MIFEGLLSRWNILFRIDLLIADLVNRDHVDGWPSLRDQRGPLPHPPEVDGGLPPVVWSPVKYLSLIHI